MHRDSDCNASFQLITVAMRHPIAAGVVHQVFGGIVRSKRTRKQMSQTMSVNSDMLADAIIKAMLRLQQMNTQPSNSQTQFAGAGHLRLYRKILERRRSTGHPDRRADHSQAGRELVGGATEFSVERAAIPAADPFRDRLRSSLGSESSEHLWRRV
jgi:hypothetical protein